MKHGRARPVPKEVAELDSLESRVIWEYIGHDPPLNARRTLDQYGYPSLRDTYARDDDQMLYKLTKERLAPLLRRQEHGPAQDKTTITRADRERSAIISPGSPLAMNMNSETPIKSETTSFKYESEEDIEADILNGNVLMVDQLWLWAVDTSMYRVSTVHPLMKTNSLMWRKRLTIEPPIATLTTFFPKRESHPTEGPMFQQADLRNSIYNELNGDLTGRCENALDLAAFVVLHAVTVLLDRTSHPDLQIFRIFEEAIGILVRP